MIVDWLTRKTRRPRFNKSTFLKIVKRHSLEGKIDLKVKTGEGYKLVPIISEQGEIPQLPGEFIRELLYLLLEGKKDPWRKNWGFLKIGPPMTLSQIRDDIKAWDEHCELFWQAVD